MPISFPREPAPPTTRSIVVDGRPLRIDVRPGTARRPPLLLVNGVGASLELFQPFVDALDPALEVIRFDVPGVGGSPLPGLPYRFSGLCRLMARLLSELGHDEADVLGISWGGGVAQHFALRHRHRCRRLVLVATGTGSLMVPARPWVLARMVTPRRYLDRSYLRRNAADLYGGSARSHPDRVSELMHAENRVGPALGYVYQLAAGAAVAGVGHAGDAELGEARDQLVRELLPGPVAVDDRPDLLGHELPGAHQGVAAGVVEQLLEMVEVGIGGVRHRVLLGNADG